MHNTRRAVNHRMLPSRLPAWPPNSLLSPQRLLFPLCRHARHGITSLIKNGNPAYGMGCYTWISIWQESPPDSLSNFSNFIKLKCQNIFFTLQNYKMREFNWDAHTNWVIRVYIWDTKVKMLHFENIWESLSYRIFFTSVRCFIPPWDCFSDQVLHEDYGISISGIILTTFTGILALL